MDRITLAQRRRRLGLSRADLARLLIVSESTVWRWEEGKTTPSRIVSAFIDQVLSARESESIPAACRDCGMRHAPDDTGACIEGHGDDPAAEVELAQGGEG